MASREKANKCSTKERVLSEAAAQEKNQQNFYSGMMFHVNGCVF